jgi:type VI secretion system protein VasD
VRRHAARVARRIRVRELLRFVVILTGFASMVACSSTKPSPLMRGSITVDQRANPDANGRPSPVVVRVYELKSLAAFSTADFFALFEKEGETLGGDLLGREEFQLDPGEKRPYQRQLQPDTKFIGVVAAFRNLERARWRQAAPIPAKRSIAITLGLEQEAITVGLK